MNSNGKNHHSKEGSSVAAATSEDQPWSVPGVRIGRSQQLTTAAPSNRLIDAANPDIFLPPTTDTGSMPSFKYPFSLSNKRVYLGGWSREVTERELPISKDLAGVNMRLEAGGIRELHWHTAAEWAIMLYGGARITAIDNEGKSFVQDTYEGDLWYFPTGIPHSIQGLGPDGCEFLLVFDDGAFSEFETVLLSNAIAHTQREVLARNFNVPQSRLEGLLNEELFIFQAPIPGPLEADQAQAAGSLGSSPTDFSFRPREHKPQVKTRGGEALIVDSSNFKVSTTVAAAMVTIYPGGMRELHWHQNANEWQYYLGGRGRMTVLGTGTRARTMDFEAGDVGYVQKTLPHYIENTGDENLRFLEIFKAPRFMDLSVSEWLTHTPKELVMAHLNIDAQTYDALPKENLAVLPK